MKKGLAVGILLIMLTTGCSTGNVLSGMGGAAVGAGAYEVHLKKMRDKVQADYDAKKIDEHEYKIRIDQIQRDSVF